MRGLPAIGARNGHAPRASPHMDYTCKGNRHAEGAGGAKAPDGSAPNRFGPTYDGESRESRMWVHIGFSDR